MRAYKFTKTAVSISIGLITLAFLCSQSFAADIKLGKISLGEVSKNSTRVKAAIEEIKKIQADSAGKINALSADVNKLEEQLKDEKGALKKEEKEKLEADLKEKVQELQSEQQSARMKMAFKQKSVQNVISSQIDQIVEKLAKEEGLAAVFRDESLVYSSGLVDLTEKVTKALDSAPALEVAPK